LTGAKHQAFSTDVLADTKKKQKLHQGIAHKNKAHKKTNREMHKQKQMKLE